MMGHLIACFTKTFYETEEVSIQTAGTQRSLSSGSGDVQITVCLPVPCILLRDNLKYEGVSDQSNSHVLY